LEGSETNPGGSLMCIQVVIRTELKDRISSLNAPLSREIGCQEPLSSAG
jgi:hypothetical protein